MILKSYNILFNILSYLANKTNGAPLFVKYKLLLGTLILGLVNTTAQVQKKDLAKDSISSHTPERGFVTRCKYANYAKESNNISDSVEVKGLVIEENVNTLN